MRKQQVLKNFPKKVVLSIAVMIVSLLMTSQAHSQQYGILHKSENSKPIKKFFVIGERCSGTTYMKTLILNNFEISAFPIGHKHFPPWYELSRENYLGNSQYYTFENTEDFLFVVIFRNAYDWVRSFNRTPWHAHASFENIPLSEFIRKPWIISENRDAYLEKQYQLNRFVDLDPLTGKVFANVFALRTAKIKTMLQIADRAPNVYYINYEIVRDHPQKVLGEISKLFPVKAKPVYTPVSKYKKTNQEYKPKVYTPLTIEDLSYINSKLDKNLEKSIGYKLISNPEELKTIQVYPK